MKSEIKKNGRASDKLDALVRFFVYGIIGVYVMCLAVDHNETREMKKRELNLSIQLLELQLARTPWVSLKEQPNEH